jgi:hypothetical protein
LKREQLWTVNPRTLEVVNLATGERTRCASLAEMMAEHRRLENEARPAAVTTARKQKKLDQVAERRQAGQ